MSTNPPAAPFRPRPERGAIIIWFALFMLVTLGFIALGIDVAKLSTARTQLQNAADAAALAGASAIDPTTGIMDQPLAVARAQATGSQNKAFINDSQPVIVNSADVSFPGENRVSVLVR